MTAFKPIKDYTDVKQKAAAIFLAIFMYAVILASVGYVWAAAEVFKTRDDITLGSGIGYITTIASGDFNGDGKIDVAVPFDDTDTLHIYLNQGDGTFLATSTSQSGEGTTGVIADDFNLDGYMDLATANRGAGNVSIFLGRGDGSFLAASNYSVVTYPWHLVSDDFNNDGYPDIAVPNLTQVTPSVSVLLNRGDGTFQSAVNYTLVGNPYYATTADFNGDNKVDLVVSTYTSSSVAVLLGNGDGTFNSSTYFIVNPYAKDVKTNDFNDDGKMDIAAASFVSNTVSILLGAGDGTFASSTDYLMGSAISVGSWGYYGSLLVADLNDDSEEDLLVGNENGSFDTRFGNGDGTFGSSTVYQLYGPVTAITRADFDNDGKNDLAVAVTQAYSYGNVSVLYNYGSGNFVLPHYVPEDGNLPMYLFYNDRQLINDDFNDDGNFDLAVANHGSNTVSVLLSTATGTFGLKTSFAVGTGPSSVASADFNGDNNIDLASANNDSNNVSVLLGVGDGTFGAASNYGAGTYPRSLTAADFNGDNKQDLATANKTSNNVSVFLGVGDGTFNAAVSYSASSSPYSITAGDFNGDGFTDLAVANYSSTNVTVLLGIGDGTFQSGISIPVSGSYYPRNITSSDLNNDGKIDLAASTVTNGSLSYIAVFLNGTPTGTFSASVNYTVTSTALYSLVAADFNNDGVNDLAVPSSKVNVLLNNGNGSFAPPTSYFVKTYSGPSYALYHGPLTAADFNHDGKVDLAAASERYGDPLVNILFNSYTSSSVTIAESGGSTVINEGGADTYSVVLDGQPTANVIVHVSPISSYISTDVSSLTFTSANWDTPQTVTITASDDSVATGRRFATIAHSVSSTDSRFEGFITQSIIGTYTDNDTAGVTLTQSGGSTNISENGLTDTYTVVLTSQPTANVNISVTASTTQVTTSLARLTFTSSNWNTPQTVMASAIDDALVEGNHTSAITHTATSTDVMYNNISVSSVTATITDNDTSGTTTSTVYGDFNGDGYQDLAISKGSSNIVSILLGVGDGTFGSAVNYNVSTSPKAIVLGYFNSDSYLDLAVANSGSDNISILLGVGNGTFGTATNYTVSSSPYSVTTGDFNVDGKTDLAVANYGSDNVSVLFGVGNGTFGSVTNYSVNSKPISIISADFNSDNKNDLAVANFSSSTVSILLNSSVTGTFSAAVNYNIGDGTFPYSITTYDFNSDNLYDIVTANSASNTVSILLNSGSGTFTLQNTTYAVGASPRSITNYDLNGDGKRDLITSNYSANTISTLFGTGIGTFATSTAYSLGTKPLTVLTTDFSGDFWPDIVVADSSASSYSILIGNRGGLFSSSLFADPVAYDVDSYPVHTVAADFNEDGNTDLVVGSLLTGTLTVVLGNGDGSFSALGSVPMETYVGGMAVSDFNSDGHLDLAFANYTAGTVSVVFGNGDGTFRDLTPYGAASGGLWVTTADVNGDNKSDLIEGDFVGTDVYVLLNNGNGTFGSATNYTVGMGIVTVSAADLNSDGKIDLIAPSGMGSTVSVLLGNGNGTFGAATPYTVGAGPFYTATTDFNGDGYFDLAVANNNTLYDSSNPGTTVSILLNNGNGTFGSATNYTVGTSPTGIASEDFNEDGNEDLAVANIGSGGNGSVSVLLGLGNGTFGSATTYAIGGQVYWVTADDLNKDSKPDLAVVDFTGSLSILLNTHTTGAGVTVSQKASTNVWEDGMTDTFSIVLAAQPSASVIITVSAPTSTQMVFYPSTLTFTSTTWYTAQTVTMAANGSTFTGNHNVTISNTASSSDSGYEGIAIVSIPVTIHKNGGGGPSVVFPISSGSGAVLSTSSLSTSTLFNLFSTSTNQQNNNNSNTNLTTTTSTPITVVTSVLSDLSKLILSTVFGRNLYVGNIGYDVKILQNILSEIPGIYPQKLKTGYYGPLTKNAVKNYQTANTIASTTIGRFDTITRGYLTKTYQLPTSSPKYLFTRSLQLGSSGTDVKVLQTILAQNKAIYPEAKITGYFDSATKKAVQRFQLKYKITSPSIYGYGIFGPKTRAKIVEMMR